MIHCGNGLLRIGSRAIREAGRGYGLLSVADIIAKSSNIGAINVAGRIGEDKLHEYVRRFGFGQSTGLPLPSESRGSLRKRERWGKTSYASIAMGHEISVTAVQLAQAASIIANNGALVKPRLILAKQRPGEPAELVPAEPPVQIIKPETAIEMRRMMERVVLSGTGKGARLKGYTSGGKTGTAQIFDVQTRKYTHTYNGSFIGFAPVQNPAVVIVVTLNGTSGGTSGYGGAVAAPVFREVATHALRLLNVPKDLPDQLDERDSEPSDVNDLSIAGLDPAAGAELASIDPLHLAQASDALGQAFFVGPPGNSRVAVGPQVPNFGGKTMREVIEAASDAGLDVEFTGSGVVRGQAPLPGVFLTAGERIRVHLSR
jgi:cell division protein FtsI (penicillin-binding protein 3)